MRYLLKASILAIVLSGVAATANAQISVGIRIGAPPPPVAYRVPPRPALRRLDANGEEYNHFGLDVSTPEAPSPHPPPVK